LFSPAQDRKDVTFWFEGQRGELGLGFDNISTLVSIAEAATRAVHFYGQDVSMLFPSMVSRTKHLRETLSRLAYSP